MANKHIQALRESNKARIDKATDADEVAALEQESKEIDELEKENEKLLKAYKTAIKAGQNQGGDPVDNDEDDDDGAETGGKGKKPLSFEEAFAKVEAQRKKG